MADVNQSPEPQEATFISHLLELRDRLLRAVGAVLLLFLVVAPFANTLYEYLAAPLMSVLPEGNTMISTEPHGPFFVPFKFAFAFATAVAMPYLLYQLWALLRRVSMIPRSASPFRFWSRAAGYFTLASCLLTLLYFPSYSSFLPARRRRGSP